MIKRALAQYEWPEVRQQWDVWRRKRPHIRAKLHASYIRKSDWFLTTHAASEAALRRIIFVGLRRKGVAYKSAQAWMDESHITFGEANGQGNFVTYFDRLFDSDWVSTLATQQGLPELWTLWNGYSKPIRNHLAHALRKYSDEWLETALAIDRLFMIRLDAAISPVIGGSPFVDLRQLSPRLARGDQKLTPESVLAIRARQPRPKIPLDEARTRLQGLCEA